MQFSFMRATFPLISPSLIWLSEPYTVKTVIMQFSLFSCYSNLIFIFLLVLRSISPT